jgi:hypothetical protein
MFLEDYETIEYHDISVDKFLIDLFLFSPRGFIVRRRLS